MSQIGPNGEGSHLIGDVRYGCERQGMLAGAEEDQFMKELELSGSFYEMGLQYGRGCRKEIDGRSSQRAPGS